MASQRNVDANGFLLVKACPITSYGLFDYSAEQVGLGGDPNRIVKVFRPESAVKDPQAIASFQNLPFINDHVMLSGFAGDEENTAPEDYGVDGVITGNVYYDAPWMRGDIKVFSRSLQQEIDAGKEDLSLGYACEYLLQPGVFEGQPYEVIQTKLRGNHIALVGVGRVSGARVLDGLCFDHLSFKTTTSSQGKEMSAKKKTNVVNRKAMDDAVAQMQALIPVIQQLQAEAGPDDGAAPADPDAAGTAAEVANTDDAGADPVTAEPDPVAAEPQMQAGGEGQPDTAALVAQLSSLMEQLKAAVSGASNGESATQATTDDDDVGEGSSSEGEGADANEVTPGTAGAKPAVTGLAEKASDAALRGFYSDLASKARVYDRLSKVVGAFDSAAMDSSAVNAYGVKKLGIKCAKGMESVALDAYLNGVEAAGKKTKQNVAVFAADAANATAEFDAYLQGAK